MDFFEKGLIKFELTLQLNEPFSKKGPIEITNSAKEGGNFD